MDPGYKINIQNSIQRTKQETPDTSPDLLWEIIKCNVRRDTVSYAFQTRKRRSKTLETLENNLSKLNTLKSDNLDDQNIESGIKQCQIENKHLNNTGNQRCCNNKPNSVL